MKLFFPLAGLFLLTATGTEKCKSKQASNRTSSSVIYKAKLETKALCMNYTIRLLDGNIDTSLLSANWTNETTTKSHKNVFGLGNPCDFPPTINQGEEFYFTIVSEKTKDCAVCMAYYPTPPKKISIKVVPAK